ncbi:hypothetical protein SDC9_91424 [bioreactor metagenome]|uniref:F5/8 type C domain-containing protein n=1 Tax=bioreactor metagenome TaxID=1076179 RepID=A0A645A1N1_9ZZZZ
MIRPFADQIYAVSFGDEQVNYAMIILIEFLEKYPDYELLKQIDREVRAKYGYGKFGIPKSGSDPDVYAWIALRKYMNDAMVGFMKEVTAKVRAINPAIKVISDDPVAAQNQTYDYTDFTPEVCDIVTHQLYPRRNPDISDFGFLTKYVSDLSQVKEFWPCMHVEEYSCSFTPDEVIEKVSESVRSGATGIHYYLADTVGTRSGVRYLHSEYFGAPERWQIEMALLEELGRMNQLKFPEPDCAIFACLDTLRSYVGVSVYPTRTMTIHSLLELQPKVFFRYFNEGSLARKLVDLSRFKVIFAPDAKYVDRPALAALETYVKNGGTLIVTDPQAFSFTPAAEDLREVRRTLLGIADAKEADANVTAFHYADLTLPVGNAGRFVLTPTAGARTAGRYNDGSSAVVEYPLGRGKVLTFGSEIGDLGNAGNPACQQLFRYLAQSNNLKCNQDIWRFRFPSTLIRPPAMPSGRCLTGNYVKWQKFLPLTGLNREAPGAAYRYAKAPDQPAESTPQEWYALADGHLTNRLKAIAKGNVDRGKSKLDEWIVGWETPEAIAIEFDLKATYPLDRLEVICRHYLRNATLGWSEDGTRWQQAEFPLEAGDNRDPQDVRRKTYRFPAGSRGRLVKLTFASRPQAEQQRLILSEVELWSPEE